MISVIRRRCLLLPVMAVAMALHQARCESRAAEPSRPNILWLTCEDTGPQLGCYGDVYATTPNLDRLAANGLRYRVAWSNAPVCAPARTAIISGVYPPSTGAEHMRSLVSMPSFMRMYPQLLRESGYYCTNNAAALRRRQTPAAADIFLGEEAARGTVRPENRPG